MKPRATLPSDVPSMEQAAEVVAELIAAMPIVLLARAIYEGFVEPTLQAGSLQPSRQG